MGLDRFESEITLFAIVVFILLGEWLLRQQQFLSGIFLYSVILLLLLLYTAYRWEHEQRYLAVLAIPSIIRVLNFTLPLGDLSPLFAQAVLALPLGLSGAVLVWLFNQPGFPLIFKWRQLPSYGLMVGLGSLVGFALFQFKQPARLIWNTPLLFFFSLVVLLIGMAFLEEWLFRGIMQTVLSNLLGKNFAGFVVALVYTVLHINEGTWMFVLVIFVFAVGLGWLRNKSESLTQVCLIHGAANLVFFLIRPWL